KGLHGLHVAEGDGLGGVQRGVGGRQQERVGGGGSGECQGVAAAAAAVELDAARQCDQAPRGVHGQRVSLAVGSEDEGGGRGGHRPAQFQDAVVPQFQGGAVADQAQVVGAVARRGVVDQRTG